MTTPGSAVRPQIEAVKLYLTTLGFRNVREHPSQPAAVERQLHTILAGCDRGRCAIRVHYDWLASQNPRSVVRWLHEHMLGDRMLANASYGVVEILPSGALDFQKTK